MAKFETAGPGLQLVKPTRKVNWGTALALAAGLMLAVGVGYQTGAKARHGVRPPAIRTNGVNSSGRVIYEVSADADALSGGDFIAVPFALPLAPGEMVSVVHSELYPEALASMGIDVDPALAGNETGGVAADVVMGQDGFPRAVRISETTDF
jgi:zinc transporter ZupT